MDFTRKTGIVRMRVACAAPDSVPTRADHTYEGVGYMLRFEVENVHNDEEMDDVDCWGYTTRGYT